MSRSAAWFVHGSVVLVGGTGLVYGWMRYFLEPADELAIVNHPQEPLLRSLHIVTAPLLIFACGLLWRTHVWGRIRTAYEHKRRSGLTLAALLAPMIASGYLLQTSVNDSWRTFWIWTHGIGASIWLAAYLWHQVFARSE